MTRLAPPSQPNPRVESKRQRLLDVSIMVVLGALVAVMGVVLERWLHSGLPVGRDLPIWSLSARNLQVGAVSTAPPGYPGLVALLSSVLGVDVLPAGILVSALALALVPALGFVLARRLGAGRWMAAFAACVVPMTPALLLRGHQFSPDPLTTVCLLLVAIAAASLVPRTDAKRVALLLGALAALYLVREHGLVAAAIAAVLLPLRPGRAHHRVLRIAALCLVVVLAPAFCGQALALPWDTSWWNRFMLVFSDLLAQRPNWMDRAMAADLANTRLDLCLHAFSGAPFAWAWVGLAALGLLRLRGKAQAAFLLGVAPTLPALLVYSQPRHVLVAVPVAAAVAAAAVSTLPRRLCAGASLLAVVLLVFGCMLTWSQEERELRVMAVSSRTLKNTGEKLCAVLDPGSLWAGEVESFTFCPLRRFAPPRGARGSLWKLVYVGDRPRGDVWERLPPPADGLRAYRFRWTGEGRPCLDSLPEPGAPFLTDRLQPLALEPPCEEPVGPLLLDAVQSLSVGH